MPVFTSSIEVTADYPTIKPSLNLNFARSRSLDPRITFTRASVGTYVGRDGLIKTAGEDEARFDHDPETLESLGLLIEESRTNLQPYSIVSDGPQGWPTLQNVTFSIPTDVSAPDGSISDNRKMIAIATNSSHSTYKQITSGSNGQVHTFSVYMKSAGYDYGYIYVDTSGGRYGGVAVQFSTGNTAVMAANGNGTQVATSVVPVGNGWYRLSVSGSFSDQNNHYCHIDVGNDLAFSQFTGDGTNGIYVWGAQLEVGSFPTSYIPTSGSTVTRAQDLGVINGTSFTDFFNYNEGTFSTKVRINGYNPTSYPRPFMFALQSSPGADFWQLVFNNSGQNFFTETRENTGTPRSNSAVSRAAGEDVIVTSAVKNGEGLTSYYGGSIRTNSSGSLSPSIDSLLFNQYDYNGTISRLSYYPQRLTDAQLQLLTS